MIRLVQLLRLLWRVIWFMITHPLFDAAAALVAFTWIKLRWPGVVVLAVILAAGLVALRLLRPAWFVRFVASPARNRWRGWFYRRHWHAAMTLAGLAPMYRSKIMLPVLGKVRVTGAVDLVRPGW